MQHKNSLRKKKNIKTIYLNFINFSSVTFINLQKKLNNNIKQKISRSAGPRILLCTRNRRSSRRCLPACRGPQCRAGSKRSGTWTSGTRRWSSKPGTLPPSPPVPSPPSRRPASKPGWSSRSQATRPRRSSS